MSDNYCYLYHQGVYMFEIGMSQKKKNGLLKGTLELGYYGLIPSSGFITGAALSTAVGMSLGIVVGANDALGWFKFAHKGKTLYIPKKPFRTGVNWNGLYNSGLIYGDDTTGLFPTATPTLQNKKVTINGIDHRVRAMRFFANDPTPNTSVVSGSELYDLFFKVFKYGGNLQTGAWETYTPVEVGITNNGSDQTGQFTLGMETLGGDATKSFLFNQSYTVDLLTFLKATTTPNSGWRPVLEAI